MEKELWLDQQEIEQLLSGTLFWQDVQNRANIKVVHKPKEEDFSVPDKQNQNRTFLMEQTFSQMTVSENKAGTGISDNISKDILEDVSIGAIQEQPAAVNAESPEKAEINEKTATPETGFAEAELAAAQKSAPELTEKTTYKIEAEEFSEEVIIEEIFEEAILDEENGEGIAAKKETFREERTIFAANNEKIEYPSKHKDFHNTMDFAWDSEELQMETNIKNGSQIEKMERSLEKTFGNGNEFKKLILERELEAGFEDKPIGGIKMFILLGVFAAITIGVWVFFLSK